MSGVGHSERQLAESAEEFGRSITPAKARWQYCFDRASYIYDSSKYGESRCLNGRTIPVVAKILGVSELRAGLNLQFLIRDDFEKAREKANRLTSIPGDRFAVGPMQGWHIGHVYFARPISHPHVVKVGFSRRVHARLGDIESKAKTKIFMKPGEIRVGTLADEHWWHREWAKHRISGEWFFDPNMQDRSLPRFLCQGEVEAA